MKRDNRKLNTENGALFDEFFNLIDNYLDKINNKKDVLVFVDELLLCSCRRRCRCRRRKR